ncbi:stage III sporulation protein AA [Geomicrobium halophilum]|uniref:Stage III sporulation protein AA n=1 Tax=Geomicrobium halophilum TaxID=549000 RepID=A0A841Q0H9_9BACL|nr:stage III sporulation protein AA [Geomicrobium halophilum]MBB6448918.1 stage III sporulation protein AA [Geomicrobium halophilum]
MAFTEVKKSKVVSERTILALIPQRFREKTSEALEKTELEEIRLRVNRPPEFIYQWGHQFMKSDPFTKSEASFVMNQLSQHSVYAFEEELRNGFLTLSGGHRVGLGGETVVEKGQVKTLKHVCSFNIRIARQMNGVAERFLPELFQEQWRNVLIVGPPQSGKTTLLRDIARTASYGHPTKKIPPRKVAIADERSEIAAAFEGIPQHDLGPRTDVLDRCPKAEGMMMLVRAMSPDILIVDEIGHERDKASLKEAMNAGVAVICSAHGRSMEDMQERQLLRTALGRPLFDRILLLNENKHGTLIVQRSVQK